MRCARPWLLKVSFHTVTDIIDGNTIEVSPRWFFGGVYGIRVRLANVDAPEPDTREGIIAKRKLFALVGGRRIELRNSSDVSDGRIVCDVFANGRNVARSL